MDKIFYEDAHGNVYIKGWVAGVVLTIAIVVVGLLETPAI